MIYMIKNSGPPILVLALAFAIVHPLSAQRPVTRIFKMPPTQPGQTSFVGSPPSHDIFYDIERGELVLVTDGVRQGKAEPVRIPLRDRAEVSAEASVGRMEGGRFQYDYTLTNGSGSRGALRRWSIFLPHDPSSVSTAGNDWARASESTEIPDRLAAQNLNLDYVHFESTEALGLEPGQRAAGLRVTSKLLPGFVSVFSQSTGVADRNQLFREVPDAARRKVEEALTPDLDGRVDLVIGPRYAPEATTLQVVAGFHMGITHLVRQRRLSEDSVFVRGALQGLSNYVQYVGEGPMLPADTAFLDSASTDLEKQIAEVLSWTLAGVEKERESDR